MLPAGCKRVAWIASTGTQYVKTGFVPNQDTRVVIDFQSSLTTGGWPIIGSRYSGSSRTYTFGSTSTNNAWVSGYNTGGVNSGVTEDSARHAADKNKNLLYLDGTLIASSTYASFTAPGDMWIFRFNSSDGDNAAYAKMRLYSCQIYDNGTLVRDYIPCIDEAGDANLWDDVNEAFAEKEGTFTAGPVVEPPAAPESVRTALSVLLRWNPSDGADSYNIYRNGALIGSTTAAQYVDTTADENETYTYGISAVGAGGESAKTEITVYTRTGYFQYKPYIQSANFQ